MYERKGEMEKMRAGDWLWDQWIISFPSENASSAYREPLVGLANTYIVWRKLMFPTETAEFCEYKEKRRFITVLLTKTSLKCWFEQTSLTSRVSAIPQKPKYKNFNMQQITSIFLKVRVTYVGSDGETSTFPVKWSLTQAFWPHSSSVISITRSAQLITPHCQPMPLYKKKWIVVLSTNYSQYAFHQIV